MIKLALLDDDIKLLLLTMPAYFYGCVMNILGNKISQKT
jgi:hypothetical protein